MYVSAQTVHSSLSLSFFRQHELQLGAVQGRRPGGLRVSSRLGYAVALGKVEPIIKPLPETSERPARKINWKGLVGESLLFMSFENAFRCMTEQGTPDAFSEPFFSGYLNSVGNLHGWNDGDPFYVNYVGHPMQGAVTGYIWTHNDLAYRNIEFGKNRHYWKGKLRGAAYSYIYAPVDSFGCDLFPSTF